MTTLQLFSDYCALALPFMGGLFNLLLAYTAYSQERRPWRATGLVLVAALLFYFGAIKLTA